MLGKTISHQRPRLEIIGLSFHADWLATDQKRQKCMIALREDLLVVFQLAFSTQQFSEDVVSEQFLRILAVATHPIHHRWL